MNGRKIASLALVATLGLSACASAPQPSNEEIADACLLLKENKNWYKSLRASSKEWGAPMGYQLAVIRQESSFDAKAKAPFGERKFFGLIRGDRLSSAYGYAQALDITWDTYKKDTGRGGADRHNFHDSVDFIGWYFNTAGKRANLGQYDYRGHYLAYHEGASGYLQGTWRNKDWLVDTANKVATQAARYETQISGCKALKPKFLGIF